MTLTLTMTPARVDTGMADEQGRLVFSQGRLVAVLVQLSNEHGEAAGQWFLEHGFGALESPDHPTFSDLEAATQWISTRRLASRRG